MNKQREALEVLVEGAVPAIRAKIHSYTEERTRYLRHGAMRYATAVVVPIVLALVVLDLFVGLPEWGRWISAIGLLSVALTILAVRWWLPVMRWNDARAVRDLERGFPELGQRLRTIREFERTPPHTPISSAFARALMAETRDRVGRIEPTRLIPWKKLRPIGITAGVALLGFGIALVGSPEFRVGTARLVMPGAGFSYTTVAVERAPEKFSDRESPSIIAKVSGRAVTAATLFVREDGGTWGETKMASAGQDRFDAVLTGRTKDLEYFIAAGDGRSEIHRMRCLPSPKMETAWIELEFPEYTGLGSQRMEGSDVSAVEGSRVRVVFQLNHPLTSASATTNDGRGLPLVISGNQLSITEVLTRGEITYQLSGTDEEGLNLPPATYKLIGVEDKLPEVKLVEPAKDLEATSVWEIVSRLQAKDDFGLAEVGIVLVAGEEMKLIAQRKIDERNVRETGEMASAMLEDFPLTINDNIKLYAFARDHKPRDGARAVSNLRAIDIRQFKTRWRVVDGGGGAGMPPVSGVQLMKLGQMIKQQRQVVSDVFILKENGESSTEALAKACDGLRERESKLTTEARRWKAVVEEEGSMSSDDLVLVDAASEQMDEAAKHFENRLTRPAYRQADRALSSLLELRKLIMKMIVKNGAPCPCSQEPAEFKTLTELAKEAERIAAEERDVRGQVAPEPKPGINLDTTRRRQQVAVTDAGELFSALIAHPEATELALQRMEKAEQEAVEADKLVQGNKPQDGEPHLQTAEDLLRELAEHLRALDKKNLAETMAKLAEQSSKAQGRLDKEQKDGKGGKPQNQVGVQSQASADQQGKAEAKQADAGNKDDGKKTTSEADKNEATKEGLGKIADRADTIEDVLKNLAHPKDSSPGDERFDKLREQVGSDSLGEGVRQLQREKREGKATGERAGELAGRFGKLAEGLSREQRRLLQSRIEKLAAAQAKTRDLMNGKQGAGSKPGEPRNGGEDNKGNEPQDADKGLAGKDQQDTKSKGGTSDGGGPANGGAGTADHLRTYLEDLESLEDDVLIRLTKPIEEDLKTGNLEIAKLQPVDERLQKMLNELLRVQTSGNGGDRVPQEYERLVEKYFRALSDDFGDEEWRSNEDEKQ